MAKEVGYTVNMIVRINFKRLVTIFNVVIICPARTSNLLEEVLTTSGAVKTPQDFIVNLGRKIEPRTKGECIL